MTFDLLYSMLCSVLWFFVGLFVGVGGMLYRYRGYILVALDSLIEAYRDGRLQLYDLIYLLVRVNAYVKEISDANSALEIIQYIKQRFNVS